METEIPILLQQAKKKEKKYNKQRLKECRDARSFVAGDIDFGKPWTSF